jgi:VanZ family protein
MKIIKRFRTQLTALSVVFWVIALIYAGFIFILSSKPLSKQPDMIRQGEETVNTTIKEVIHTVKPSAAPLEPKELYSIQHVILYFGLGFFLYAALSTMNNDYIRANAFIIASYLGYAYGVSDEVHQYFVPTRTSLLETTFLNGFGGICGAGAAIGLRWLGKKFIMKLNPKR